MGVALAFVVGCGQPSEQEKIDQTIDEMYKSMNDQAMKDFTDECKADGGKVDMSYGENGECVYP